MKWVIVALKHWEIGVCIATSECFLHETFGGGETWGCQILGRGKGGYSQNKGGVALHHQLLSSKDSRIAKKRKEKKRKDLLLFI
jgi:hypothetical protein